MDYEEIKKEAISCQKCDLSKTRQNVVWGDGRENAKIVFIGEGPGTNEDLQGKPFIGRAGMLLNELLRGIEIKRDDVFISNIIKCRPPGNRDPTPDEIKTCYPYLDFQINHIKPKVIIPLGRHSAKLILERYGIKFEGISKEHGRVHEVSTSFGRLNIVPMYHPAAAIYNQYLLPVLKKDFEVIRNLFKDEEYK